MDTEDLRSLNLDDLASNISLPDTRLMDEILARVARLEAEAYARESAFVARARQGQRPYAKGPTPVMRAARPSLPDVPVPVTVPAVEGILRKAKGGPSGERSGATSDPVRQIMNEWSVTGLSRDEFLSECKDKILELIHDELELDNERRETLGWNSYLPMC